MILDITSLLKNNSTHKNYYIFNNSVCHLKDNIFLVLYRVIFYNNLDKEYHPWDVWWNGKKLFKNESNSKSSDKFRISTNEPDFFIKINETNNFKPNINEYDSTGLALLRFVDDSFILLHKNDNIFGNTMNQDARIYKFDNKFFISYNGFIKDSRIFMFKRELIFNWDDNSIYFSEEEEMFKHSRNVEKNCVFDNNFNVLYEIGDYFRIINPDNNITSYFCPILNDIINFYGKNNIIFSLSTSPIPFNNNFLALGHLKICYKKDYKNTKFNEFLQQIDWKFIFKHGKFIYFMFFFEFDSKYNILRISDAFIPNDNSTSYLPYLLVFPMSFIQYHHHFIISYGEGDEKAKFLFLSKDEIEHLLYNPTPQNFSFKIRNNPIKIPILGYYGQFNCGDDAFALVFNHILKKCNLPNYILFDFKTIDKISFKHEKSKKLIIIGGGDLINDFFIQEFQKKIEKFRDSYYILGISLGIPYESQFHKISLFDEIYLRNSRDKISNKIHYLPDLCFLLPRVFTFNIDFSHIFDGEYINVGLILSRTYYKKDKKNNYFLLIHKISNVINKIIHSNNKIRIFLIPFCINSNKNHENDIIINNHIKSLISDNRVINLSHIINESIYIHQIYSLFSYLDFTICSRFHAHIFSLIHNIPFLSLSCSRKCEELMLEFNLSQNLIKFDIDNEDIPFDFDDNLFLQKFNDLIKNKNNIISFNFNNIIDNYYSIFSKILSIYSSNNIL